MNFDECLAISGENGIDEAPVSPDFEPLAISLHQNP